MPYNCLYLNKGNISSVKGLILTKLIGYRESMVIIICTKNESNLTSKYWDMVPDRRKVWTDGRKGQTDAAKTISLRLRWGIISTHLLLEGQVLVLLADKLWSQQGSALGMKQTTLSLIFQLIQPQLWIFSLVKMLSVYSWNETIILYL